MSKRYCKHKYLNNACDVDEFLNKSRDYPIEVISIVNTPKDPMYPDCHFVVFYYQ